MSPDPRPPLAARLRHRWWRLRHPVAARYRLRILIAGQPKSGTTALYYMVCAALPFVPRRFEPPQPLQQLHPEWRPYCMKQLIAPRGAEALAALAPHFDRRILLLRDPRDRLISFLFYHLYHLPLLDDPARRDPLLALLRAKEAAPASLPLLAIQDAVVSAGGSDAVAECLARAAQAADLVGARSADFHLLRYEDLVAGRTAAAEAYLGLRLRRSPARTPTQQRVLRSGIAGDWRNWFTDADVAALRPRLAPLLAPLGYADDWTLNRPAALDPARGSGYLLRLAAVRPTPEARA